MNTHHEILNSYVREFLVIEAKAREVDTSDGTRVPFGSKEHVSDLEIRIADLSRWRDRQKRGSEARANYARIIARLKNELRVAKRTIQVNNES